MTAIGGIQLPKGDSYISGKDRKRHQSRQRGSGQRQDGLGTACVSEPREGLFSGGRGQPAPMLQGCRAITDTTGCSDCEVINDFVKQVSAKWLGWTPGSEESVLARKLGQWGEGNFW